MAVSKHHFACMRCDYVHQIPTLELAKLMDGWPIEEKKVKRPNRRSPASSACRSVPCFYGLIFDRSRSLFLAAARHPASSFQPLPYRR
jgi:hypothetical protein